MAIYRDRPCLVCNGRGVKTRTVITDLGGCSWTENCENCYGTGTVQVAITNSERIAELRTPEDQLKFMRGFAKWAKYGDEPLRLLNPEESDEDMLIWLNKESDNSDYVIFENI